MILKGLMRLYTRTDRNPRITDAGLRILLTSDSVKQERGLHSFVAFDVKVVAP